MKRLLVIAGVSCLLGGVATTPVAGGDTLPLTTPGSGSVTIPAGYEWTDVTVQCWGGGGGGGGGSDFFGAAGGGGGAYAYNSYATLPSGTYNYFVGTGGNYGYYYYSFQGWSSVSAGSVGGNTIWNYGGSQDIYATGGSSGLGGAGGGGSGGLVLAGSGFQGGAGGGGGIAMYGEGFGCWRRWRRVCGSQRTRGERRRSLGIL